jgi:hypothetical protein
MARAGWATLPSCAAEVIPHRGQFFPQFPGSLKKEKEGKMSQEQVPFWDALVAKRMSQHFRQFHTAEAVPGRRSFLRSMAGLGLGSGLLVPERVRAASNLDGGGDEDDGLSLALPKPIPGGESVFGVLIHHFPVPPPGTPLANLTEPSQITDFRGFVGDTSIRGAGVGISNGVEMPLAFKADMGFMKGEYIGEDGRHHQNTFGFIWLDIYTGPVGSTNVAQQIHDYNPGIPSNGLFWTIAVPPDSVQIDLDNATASFRLDHLRIMDSHDLANSLTNGQGTVLNDPPIPPIAAVPAIVSFDVRWSGVVSRAKVTNLASNFTGEYIETVAAIKWSAIQAGPPAFAFVSEDPNPARTFYAVIGRERNGVFFRRR